jgi:NADPH:quinone reductase-like Zn-dependent oxidoreductase
MEDISKIIANLSPEKRAQLLAKLSKSKNKTEQQQVNFAGNFEYRFNSDTPFDYSAAQTEVNDPPPGYVQVRAMASSLNFRDVMIASKQYPASPGVPMNMGSDYAGLVEKTGAGVTEFKPGDEVIAIFVGNMEDNGTVRDNSHFIKTFNVHKECVCLKPKNVSFAQASCIPTVFLTSYIGLIKLARLNTYEKVLIHTASGGVGQAAVQLAKWKKAEIFATAGTEEKRQHLKSQGIEHVYDSRSTDFAEAISSKSQELDVVLNTLSADLMVQGIKLLKPFGRFIHLDKKDIALNSNLNMDLFIKGISFQFLDISLLFLNPTLLNQSLREIVALFEDKSLNPIHYVEFPVTELKKAVTMLARSTHVGKIVVRYD